MAEFQEHGFELDVAFQPERISFDDALDKWIAFVESRGWAFGGGGDCTSARFSGFLCVFGRGTLIPEDRGAVENWLLSQDWVKDFTLGQLQDSWYGWPCAAQPAVPADVPGPAGAGRR